MVLTDCDSLFFTAVHWGREGGGVPRQKEPWWMTPSRRMLRIVVERRDEREPVDGSWGLLGGPCRGGTLGSTREGV